MKQSLLKLAEMQQNSVIDFNGMMHLLGHSLSLGAVLMGMATWTGLASPVVQKKNGPPVDPVARLQDIIINSANVLFLCFGVTGVMILVNNDLARAFAIGAAIAMVRFRVKMNESTSASMLFAVVIGMACGVDQPMLAWGIGGVFTIVQAVILVAVRLMGVRKPIEEPEIKVVPVSEL